MDAEEKEKQLESSGKPDELDAEAEANIFFPENNKVKIEDREYEIKPLKLKQMKLLLRLSKIDLKSIDEEKVDSMRDGIAEIIGEKDTAFLEENLDLVKIKEIFIKVREQTYAGMPKQARGALPGQ